MPQCAKIFVLPSVGRDEASPYETVVVTDDRRSDSDREMMIFPMDAHFLLYGTHYHSFGVSECLSVCLSFIQFFPKIHL